VGTMNISFVSLNIAGYKDWELRLPKIVEFLDNQSAGVVLLQEVRFDTTKSTHQAAEINNLLNKLYPHSLSSISRFYRPSVGEPYREGLSILSRHPIEDSETLVLNQAIDDKHSRIIQIADVIVDGTSIHVCNVHFSNNAHSVSQLSETLSVLKTRDDEVIISGDFNIFDLSANAEIYNDKYVASTEVKSYVSFPSESKTLDYVLIPKSMSFESLEVIPELSDHSALVYGVTV
jgi:endonuclease/exonuclease/phosphatase family metal-dependent hydrolase